jgi:hypothetical protein
MGICKPNVRVVGWFMSEKAEVSDLETQLQQSLDATRCPHCNVLNPVIRCMRTYRSPCGWVILFSCMNCKRVISCGLEPDK